MVPGHTPQPVEHAYVLERPNITESETPWDDYLFFTCTDRSAIDERVRLPGSSSHEFTVEYELTAEDLELINDNMFASWEHVMDERWETEGEVLSWDWINKKMVRMLAVKLTIEDAKVSSAISQHSGHVNKKHVLPNPVSGETRLIKCKLETIRPWTKEPVSYDGEFKVKIDDLYQSGRTVIRKEDNFVDGVYEFEFEAPAESSYLFKVKPKYKSYAIERLTTLVKVND